MDTYLLPNSLILRHSVGMIDLSYSPDKIVDFFFDRIETSPFMHPKNNTLNDR